jgi:nitrate/nitrite-specific signal transduction histidine kinase
MAMRAARLFARLLVAAALVAPVAAEAQITDVNTAINKAGRQRMLSQRLAKAYLQVWQKVDPARSQKIIDQSVALFDRQLVELKNYAPSPEIRDTYLQLEKSWSAYKDLLVGSVPSTDGAPKVVSLSDEVLALAHQGTVQLERHSGTAAGQLVNVAGRERMLSQRMAKFYQVLVWSVPVPTARADLEKARAEFLAGMKQLVDAPQNSAAIREELELAQQQWIFFDGALRSLERADDRRGHASNVATSSERILEVMDKVTGLYEKL